MVVKPQSFTESNTETITKIHNSIFKETTPIQESNFLKFCCMQTTHSSKIMKLATKFTTTRNINKMKTQMIIYVQQNSKTKEQQHENVAS